jgi:hypothetical protein
MKPTGGHGPTCAYEQHVTRHFLCHTVCVLRAHMRSTMRAASGMHFVHVL